MARNNGFDAIRDGLGEDSNQFNLYAYDQVSDFSSVMGIDAASASIGDKRGYLAIDLTDSNGDELGTVGLIDSRWGYSLDKNLMHPTNSMKEAVFGVINHHIDNGGVIS
ncbi:hypothetical protein [Nostoc sp. MG11]|uniref:hypothetical protein n=1 Tax=Nostoc sp. MG11 TaxID=2721166 RepID=UPI0018666A6F|nr:hypothetical protein [Nostoc sp. MG11]